MRSACFLGICFLWGCGTVVETTPFRPIGDLATTNPRSLVEAGHSTAVSPPPGVHFTLQLQVIRETPNKGPQTQHYEMLLTVRQPGPDAGQWAADLHGADLVDDEGHTLRTSQVLRQPSETRSVPGRRKMTFDSYRVIFDLPLSYQPRRVTRATVHWALAAGSGRIPISSRFQRSHRTP
ncbi:MAG: hypothetical protein V3U11_05830 [Planctomycetota bacterium]